MKLTLLIFAVFFIALTSSSEEISSAIIGGSDATIEEFPYMAGIFNLGLFNCGGAIISARSVLTVCETESFITTFT